MRKMAAILSLVAVGTSLAASVPASAAFGAIVQLPDDSFYSPYGGR